MCTLASGATGKLQGTERMFETRIRLELPEGLHARPAAQIVEFMAERSITGAVLTSSNLSASIESVLELMLLGAKRDDWLVFRLSRNLDQAEIIALSNLVGSRAND